MVLLPLVAISIKNKIRELKLFIFRAFNTVGNSELISEYIIKKLLMVLVLKLVVLIPHNGFPLIAHMVYRCTIFIARCSRLVMILLFRAAGQGVFDPKDRRQTNGVQARGLRVLQQLRGSMYG